MTKYLLIAIVLLSLIIAKGLDVGASQATLTPERTVDFDERPEDRVREKRFLTNPITKIVNLWNTLGQMYQIIYEVSMEIVLCFYFSLFGYLFHFLEYSGEKLNGNDISCGFLSILFLYMMLSSPAIINTLAKS